MVDDIQESLVCFVLHRYYIMAPFLKDFHAIQPYRMGHLAQWRMQNQNCHLGTSSKSVQKSWATAAEWWWWLECLLQKQHTHTQLIMPCAHAYVVLEILYKTWVTANVMLPSSNSLYFSSFHLPPLCQKNLNTSVEFMKSIGGGGGR